MENKLIDAIHPSRFPSGFDDVRDIISRAILKPLEELDDQLLRQMRKAKKLPGRGGPPTDPLLAERNARIRKLCSDNPDLTKRQLLGVVKQDAIIQQLNFRVTIDIVRGALKDNSP